MGMAFLVAKARLAALPIVAKPNVDCIIFFPALDKSLKMKFKVTLWQFEVHVPEV